MTIRVNNRINNFFSDCGSWLYTHPKTLKTILGTMLIANQVMLTYAAMPLSRDEQQWDEKYKLSACDRVYSPCYFNMPRKEEEELYSFSLYNLDKCNIVQLYPYSTCRSSERYANHTLNAICECFSDKTALAPQNYLQSLENNILGYLFNSGAYAFIKVDVITKSCANICRSFGKTLTNWYLKSK